MHQEASVQVQVTQPQRLLKKAPLDRPFIAQDEPEHIMEDQPEARTADAYNRRFKRETMARNTRPARAQPRARTQPASKPRTSKQNNTLELDLGFLAPPRAQGTVDLFDFGATTGGPRHPGLHVEEGEQTWLNSRAVEHGGFYRRLNQAIAAQWNPAAIMNRRDPTGMLYGSQDRVTVLHLRLNQNGALLDAPKILETSGLRMLDQEAVRAVVAAAPFSNPPKALIEQGVVDLGRYSFYLEVHRSRFHIQRGR